MNTNQKPISSLTVGETFTLSSSRGTVYKVESIRNSQGSGTHIIYSLADDPTGPKGSFTKPGLTTATLV